LILAEVIIKERQTIPSKKMLLFIASE